MAYAERESALAKGPRGTKAPTAGPSKLKAGKEKPRVDRATIATEQLNQQLLKALWIPTDTDDETKRSIYTTAQILLDGLNPTDAIEGMLAIQIVATHHAAMECMRRAMIPSDWIQGFELGMKHAAKLMTIYARQVEALDKHRGKGQQKITVEHMNVEAGGQAVVGHVETGAAPSKSSDQSQAVPKDITHAPRKVFEMTSRELAPVKRSIK